MRGLSVLIFPLFLSLHPSTASKTNISGKEKVCMRDIGCFEITEDFNQRPVNVLPQDRRLINTQFFLYTRNNPSEKHILIANKPKSLIYSPFDVSLPTKFIVHGFLDTLVFAKWQEELKDELMKHDEYNIIIVDWSGGNQLPYFQATANTRVVGAEIAFLIKQLKKHIGFNIKTCHIIGHSLGAHIAGYAGERLKNLNRITALDPAGPYFQDMPLSVRIDPSDARFVDVVHTDSANSVLRGFGMSQLVGHLDFFPNDGRSQPGCEASKRIWSIITDGLVDGLRNLASCSHQRAIDFFKSSINLKGCQHIGHRCSNWTEFINGNCIGCGSDKSECAIMGLRADQFKRIDPNNSMEFFLLTQKDPPYCGHHYRISIGLSEKNKNSLKGKLSVVVSDETGKPVAIPLNEKATDLSGGSTLSFVVLVPSKLNLKNPIEFSWSSDSIFSFDTINVETVEILPMDYEDKSILMHYRATYHQQTNVPVKENTKVKMFPDTNEY